MIPQPGNCYRLRFDPAEVVMVHRVEGERVFGRWYDANRRMMSFDLIEFMPAELGDYTDFPVVADSGLDHLQHAKELFVADNNWEAAASVRDLADKIKKLKADTASVVEKST